MNLDQIANVVVTFADHSMRTYTMPKDHVDMFFDATVKLHYEPGINPYNGNATAKIKMIDAYEMVLETVPYWWSMPSLDMTDDKRGACLIQNGKLLKNWLSDEAKAELARELMEEEDAE